MAHAFAALVRAGDRAAVTRLRRVLGKAVSQEDAAKKLGVSRRVLARLIEVIDAGVVQR